MRKLIYGNITVKMVIDICRCIFYGMKICFGNFYRRSFPAPAIVLHDKSDCFCYFPVIKQFCGNSFAFIIPDLTKQLYHFREVVS